MQAIIMAGGKGTRLASITKDEIPKPMVDILGKPLLEWQVEQLKTYGIKEICFVIGHLGEKIEAHFGDGSQFGFVATYIRENEPLGTAGALYYVRDWLKERDFILVFGDVFFNIDLSKMVEFHKCNCAVATLFVHPNSHPFDSDLVVLDNDSRVVGFDSKHNTRDYWYDNCVNAGLYILNRNICDRIPEHVNIDLEREILAKLISEGNAIFGYRSPEYIKDIGTVERISSTISDIKSGFVELRCLKNKQKCIFLDRDGTINVYKGLLSNIEDFEFEQTVVEAIRRINNSAWLAIIVTNQPIVARGLCEIDELEQIHRKLSTMLGKEGAYIDSILYCPHHPDKGYPEEKPQYKIKCNCRKPEIGMLRKCETLYNVDLTKSWIVGDTTSDLKTGENAGMKKALVLTGEAGKDGKYKVQPDIIGNTLLEVITEIIDGIN